MTLNIEDKFGHFRAFASFSATNLRSDPRMYVHWWAKKTDHLQNLRFFQLSGGDVVSHERFGAHSMQNLILYKVMYHMTRDRQKYQNQSKISKNVR